MRSKSHRLLSLALAASLACPGVFAARFVDTSGNWAEPYINILSDKGVLVSAPDGKFKPDEPVSRAVLAVWLVKVLGIENQPIPAKPSFPDVKADDWFFRAVEIIRQNNYISGYADGFRPNQFIQKGEVVSILSRALNRPAPNEAQIDAELAKYKDASKVPTWARAGVAEASAYGILLVGPDTQTIGADKLATRGDVSALLFKLDEFLSKRNEADAVRQATAGRPSYPPPPSNYAAPPVPNGAGMPPPSGQPYMQPNYQGQVTKGDYFGAQTPYSSNGPGQQYGGYAYGQAPAPQYGTPPPQPGVLQGGIVVLAAGTKFHAQLKNSLDSASTQVGEEIRATINEPIYANGAEVIPAGSRLIGQASSVTPAHRFKAGANGSMEIKFTTCETPDGRRIPLSASIDVGEKRMSGGTTAGRVGKGLVTTGVGAASGAVLGTALGAIVGGTAHGNVGASTGMGAVFGTALGAGVGAGAAIVRKGSELKIAAGTSLPIKLDDQMPIQLAQPGAFQQYPPGGH